MKPIHDIFSKSEKETEKPIEKLKIIVDSREKNSLIVSELVRIGFTTEIKQLEVGDYIIKNTFIERKTVSDFISSMLNKRLIRQLQDLQQIESKLLIIEGIEEQELYHPEQGVNENAVRGFLLSIVLNYQIPIIFTKNYEDTAQFLRVLAKKPDKEIEQGLNPRRKSFDKNEQMQFIVEGFPGIGPKTAKKLLEEFKTIKNIVNTSIEELEKVIGKKAKIFEIACLTYSDKN